MLKEFRVCYTLDGDVKWGNIRKKSSIKKDDVFQEIIKRIERCDFIIIKSDNNIITTSKVRYIRIFDEKRLTH
ncbi:hypothetical protein LIT25_07685 [Bacillus sp. F19]|nr:hypothetical protein LIT25_07685 [Bacillus sp. F19]